MNKKLSRGEVWFVQLDPTIGHEQAKTRPCLIISNNTFNHGPAELHIILPLTTKNKNHPFHITVEWSEDEKSEMESFILCDQIRTVSRHRFKGKSLGTVSDETIQQVETILNILLNL